MPQNQIDSLCCFNGVNGVEFFPRGDHFGGGQTYPFPQQNLQWQERNSEPLLVMKTPNRKQVQPDYNLWSEVYISFLIIGKKTQQQYTLHLLC